MSSGANWPRLSNRTQSAASMKSHPRYFESSTPFRYSPRLAAKSGVRTRSIASFVSSSSARMSNATPSSDAIPRYLSAIRPKVLSQPSPLSTPA
ncbi:MAG: hypothetical protein BWY81_00098 [Firmicutes bacterium ADurb.Bin467]|nr:MAG: hypothetical protein BWY81_00098 [Firmicutes bacterium ADurb.Bin467]